VQISFGEPIRVDSAADRKRIAREAETEVRRLHAAAMRGRPLPRQVAKQAAVH
jgi:hypothetical protein